MSEEKEVKDVQANVQETEQLQKEVKDIEDTPISASTLSQVIQNIHLCLEDARDLITKYQKKFRDLSDKEAMVLDIQKKNSDKERSLVDRESAVSKVENVQALHTQAEHLMDTAQARLKSAVEAEAELRRVTSEETQKLNDTRLLTQREAQAVERQKKAIDDEVSKRVQEFLLKAGLIKPAAEAVVPITLEEPKG